MHACIKLSTTVIREKGGSMYVCVSTQTGGMCVCVCIRYQKPCGKKTKILNLHSKRIQFEANGIATIYIQRSYKYTPEISPTTSLRGAGKPYSDKKSECVCVCVFRFSRVWLCGCFCLLDLIEPINVSLILKRNTNSQRNNL